MAVFMILVTKQFLYVTLFSDFTNHVGRMWCVESSFLLQPNNKEFENYNSSDIGKHNNS